MDVELTGARLVSRQEGMAEEDDSVLVWETPDGGVLLEVRGSARRTVRLAAGDALIVGYRVFADGADTTLTLVRGGERTLLASGGISMTADGLHGPTLAAKLEPAARRVGCAVELVRAGG
jgi:hypothetical protein